MHDLSLTVTVTNKQLTLTVTLGEYIAIENMESNYVKSKYVNMVNGGIMVHGDGDIDAPIALVQAQVFRIPYPLTPSLLLLTLVSSLTYLH